VCAAWLCADWLKKPQPASDEIDHKASGSWRESMSVFPICADFGYSTMCVFVCVCVLLLLYP